MFRIGEFARLAQVSIRLLRHYDQLGLLHPACVDNFTGYRYYTLDQLKALHRILALKDLGLSLDQIAVLMTEPVSAEQLRGMLMLKQAELRQRVAEEQARLARVEERLKHIEQEGREPDFDVVMKSVPALHVLSIRKAMRPPERPNDLFLTASARLREAGLRGRVEAILGLYHTAYLRALHPNLPRVRMLFEAAFALPPDVLDALPFDNGRRIQPRDLPACETVATVLFKGADTERQVAHRALWRWMERGGWTLTAPTREIYLHRAPDPADHVTEVQFPVRKLDVLPP